MPDILSFTDTRVVFTTWSTHGTDVDDNCLQMHNHQMSGYAWDDEDCSKNKRYLCQIGNLFNDRLLVIVQ